MAKNTPDFQQQIHGTTAQLGELTGKPGTLAFDLSKKAVVGFDGVKAGGYPSALEERKIQSGTTALKVNGGTEADLSRDITLTIDDTALGSPTWVKRVNGAVPEDDAELQEVLADVPHGGAVYFTEGEAAVGDWGDLIMQPVVLTPEADAQVGISVLVTGSAFSKNPEFAGDINHTGTTFTLSYDPDGFDIISEYTYNTPTVSHTFNIAAILPGKVVYARIQYISAGILSVWSEPRKFSIANAIETDGGRKLYRDDKGLGSILVFNDAILGERKVLIADASLRFSNSTTAMGATGLSLFMVNSANSSITSKSVSGIPQPTITIKRFDYATQHVLTDSEIDAAFGYPITYYSYKAAAICDAFIATFGESVTTAVSHARTLKRDGRGMDIADAATLIRVLCDAAFIDALDITLDQYPTWGLANKAFIAGGSNDTNLTSCTPCVVANDTQPYVIYFDGSGIVASNTAAASIYSWQRKNISWYIPTQEITV